MSNAIHITINDGHLLHDAYLIEDATAANSFTINGKRYAVSAREADLPVVLDALNALYPGAVTSAKPLIGRVSRLEANVSGLGKIQGTWMREEEAYLTNMKRKIAEAYLADPKEPDEIKAYLLTKTKKVLDDFDVRFDQAIAAGDVEQFLPLLDQIPEDELCGIIFWGGYDIPIRQDILCNQWIFTEQAKKDLKQYIQDSRFSGSITLQDANPTSFTLASEGIDPATPFAIHSVGKVFTAVLLLRLIQLGKIPKSVLEEPLQLDPAVFNRLPEKVQKHLRENRITLLQLMMHEGGLGEYMDNYLGTIGQALESKTDPPKMDSLEDFLKYGEEQTYPVGETKYSNLGLLLVGLSVQHLAQQPFNDLMMKYIIAPAKMNRFSSKKPEDARTNPSDPIAAHIYGSSAGGYWTTSADLCKFGGWICGAWKDPAFKQLVETYGSEFYSNGEIHHDGIIPSASAYLSIFPEHQVTIAILSDINYPGATEMNHAIRSCMLHA